MANLKPLDGIKHNRLRVFLKGFPVFLISLTMLLSVNPLHAHRESAWPQTITHQEAQGLTDPAELEAFLDGVINTQLAEHNVAGATLAVVKDGALFLAKGYGYADVANRVPVDPETTLFRVGSITKLFTWTAVMQLAEQGRLDLEADVNTYLDFEIPATLWSARRDAAPEAITLEHLLTHTPGFEDRGSGIAAASPEEMPPHGQWLAANIPARVRPPGEFSSYSNYGTSLAGYIVERVAGMPYDDYVEKHILQPLGMEYATSRQPLPADLVPDMSGGYKYTGGAYEAQDFELIIVAPAGAFSASASDMARFMIAHLQDGRYGEARILQESTAQRMHSRLFSHDERLNGFAHGFYEMSQNGQWIIGHGGDTMLFHSLLALLPDQNLGLFVSYNSECAFLPSDLLGAFVDRYYPEVKPQPEPPAGFAGRAGRFAGSYRMNRSSYTTAEKVVGLFSSITVGATDDGALLASSPLGEQRFVESEPLVFREVGGDDVLLFRENKEGEVTHAFLDSVPMIALEKLRWYEVPTFHYVLLGVCLLLFLSVLVVGPIGFFVGRGRDRGEPQPRLARLGRWLLAGVSLSALLLPVLLGIVLSDEVALMTGQVPMLSLLSILIILMIVLTIGAVVLAVLAWKNRYWNVPGRVHYSLVTLGALAFIWFLYYWNLLGRSL